MSGNSERVYYLYMFCIGNNFFYIIYVVTLPGNLDKPRKNLIYKICKKPRKTGILNKNP